MNADCHYQIGKDHVICQDYALAKAHGNLSYAIVCDGCSASGDVDFGARALALAARETLKVARERDNEGKPMDYRAFGITAVRRADCLWAMFPSLDQQYLDATLLIAWIEHSRLTAYLYGDGMFFHKSGNSTRAIHIDFKIPDSEKSAPAYLSYELDGSRKEGYQELKADKIVYDCILSEGKESGTESAIGPFDPVVITAPVAPGDIITVCSDGINSFKEGGVTRLDWRTIVPGFTGFKDDKGVFVRRRMNGFRRECDKKLWTHSDDISLAAISV